MTFSRHVLEGVLVAVALAVLTPSVTAAKECRADVRARLTREDTQEEVSLKTFAVEIDTQETCAKVYVDFTATERLFNGEEITTTRRGYRKVTGPATYVVTYRIERDSDLVNWKFTVAQCVVCGTE
jgi:hypothetical protein